MAEGNSVDIFCLNGHISSIAVTGHTVAADAEGATAVMAGPAGLSVFHLLHADLVAVGLGSERVRMTFIATEHPCMDIMTEKDGTDSALDRDIFRSLMTAAAVTLDAECGITIMASAA